MNVPAEHIEPSRSLILEWTTKIWTGARAEVKSSRARGREACDAQQALDTHA
jgi:hypothetical protein